MKIGRVEVSGSFFLLIAWLNYLDQEMFVPLALLACALHELGHYVAIRTLGHNVKLIRLSAVGAEMVLDRSMGYWQEIAAAAAGPAVNFILAFLFSRYAGGLLFSGLNLIMGIFNLMPVGSLDGGRVVKCMTAMLFGPDRAEAINKRINVLVCVVLLWGGIFLLGAGGNGTLLMVAVWLGVSLFCRKGRNRACLNGWKQVK